MTLHSRIAALIFCLLLLCSCAAEPAADDGAHVYYLSADPAARGLFSLEAALIPRSGDTPAEQAGAILSAMRRPPSENRFSVIPEDVSVLSVRENGSMIRVELSPEYSALDSGSRGIAAAAIAMSLLDIPGVQYVAITTAGENQAPYNVSYYTRNNLFINDDILILDNR